MSVPGLPAPPFLYPILDLARTRGRSPAELVRAAARAGVGIVQLRAKDLPDSRFLEAAVATVRSAREAGVKVIVNDRPDVARLCGADGVHLGQDDLPAAAARELLPEAIIGVSTHDRAQLAAALDGPADYVAVGPVFGTTSKDDPDPVVGPDFVRLARAATDRPIVAIGGITRARAATVVKAGADGLAVIGDLLDAPELDAALAGFAAVLNDARGV